MIKHIHINILYIKTHWYKTHYFTM